VLTNLGLPELITDSADGFVRSAIELATDVARLRAIRSTLRERMQASPLRDEPAFARDLESAYRTMWRQWCGGGAG
jgi:predicted O-linked N-acetylglucosamine transferase (SPINDLY family)